MVQSTTIISALLVVIAVGSSQAASMRSEVVKAVEIEYIAGLVMYRIESGQIEYILLQKISELDDWSVPKGHIEAGEDENMGAIRETWEETGLLESDYTVVSNEKLYFEYTTNAGLEKRVTLFPAKLTVPTQPILISPEHNSFVWVKYNTGVTLIKKQYKDAFIAADSIIRRLEGLST